LSFDTESNLEGDIYIVNADGSGLQQLIEDGFWADWSPDGTQIAFQANPDAQWDIYVINADGTDRRRLTTDVANDTSPDWVP
jgi:TolB protein